MLNRLKFLRNLFSEPSPSAEGQRPRLALAERPELVCAIGDVHGRYDLLRRLEQQLTADAAGIAGRKLIVMLGDYVDRGPQSREVIEHLLAPPPDGFERICLAGNHEQVMQAFLADSARNGSWLEFGGTDTLASYGIYEDAYAGPALRRKSFAYVLESSIPDEHRQFLAALPSLLVMPGFAFVHAGIRPGVSLADQSDSDLLWIRQEFFDASDPDAGLRIVHGHTPVAEPEVTPYRIDIDTGAYMSGCLTALCINASGEITFCFAR